VTTFSSNRLCEMVSCDMITVYHVGASSSIIASDWLTYKVTSAIANRP